MRYVTLLNRLGLCALLLLVPITTWADNTALEAMAPERITWRKTPIELALMVGKELRVDFPGRNE